MQNSSFISHRITFGFHFTTFILVDNGNSKSSSYNSDDDNDDFNNKYNNNNNNNNNNNSQIKCTRTCVMILILRLQNGNFIVFLESAKDQT